MNNKINKIVLIWPDFAIGAERHITPPISILSIGAYLKKRIPNIEIYILDGQFMSLDEISKKILQLKPEIVGISTFLVHYSDVLALARKAKIVNAQVVLGGAYATTLKKEILKNRGYQSSDYCVDAIIQMDGEKAFYEYVIGKPLAKINNLIYYNKSEIKENFIKLMDLNELSVLDDELIDLEKYFKNQQVRSLNTFVYRRILPVYGHKGCWWRKKSGGCIFCSSMDKACRVRNPGIFAQKIAELVLKYDIEFVEIVDENFLGDNQWFEKFFRVYQKCIQKMNKWPLLTIGARSDEITSEIAWKLEKINISNIFIGIESGAQECINSAKKGTSLIGVKKAIKLLNKHRIGILGLFIVGLPNETRNTLIKTIDLIKEMFLLNHAINIRFREFTPLPGSLSWQMLLEKTRHKYKWKDLIDWDEVRKDWKKHFCNLSLQDIIWFKKEIMLLSEQQKDASFFLFDKFI